jgi:hypothetical protein
MKAIKTFKYWLVREELPISTDKELRDALFEYPCNSEIRNDLESLPIKTLKAKLNRCKNYLN